MCRAQCRQIIEEVRGYKRFDDLCLSPWTSWPKLCVSACVKYFPPHLKPFNSFCIFAALFLTLFYYSKKLKILWNNKIFFLKRMLKCRIKR